MSDGLSNTLPQASRPDTSHSMIGYGKHIVPPNLALHTQREHRAPWFLDTNLNMRMAVPNTDAPPGILAPPVDIQQSHKLQNLGGRKNAKFDSSLAKPKGNELAEHVQSTPSSTGSSVTPVSIQDEQRTSDQLRTPHFSARFERDESNCVSPPRRRIIFSLDNHQSLCDDNSSVIPRPSTQIHSFLVGHPESVPRSSYFGVQDPFYEMSERKPAGESDCESGVDNKEEIQDPENSDNDDLSDEYSFFGDDTEIEAVTESENSLDGKDDEDKVKDDIYPPPANQTEAIRNAKEADKIRRAKIAEYFPRLNRLMGEICNHANADPEQVQTYAFSVSNSARVRKSSKWSEFEKIWISIEGKEKLIDCVIKHYKKRGIIMTDSDITKNTAYSAFLDRSEEKQLEILRRLQEYILLKNPISQRNRKNEFKKYCKTIESFVQYYSDLHGFESSIITVGGYLNSDHQLGKVIETRRVKGVMQETFRIEEKLAVGGLKAKACLASVERAMDTVERGRMQQPHGRLCENSPSELKLSSTPTQSQSNTAPNAEDEAAMTFTSIKSPKDCLFKILTDDQANSMIDELLRSKTFWSDAKSMLWKCWSFFARPSTVFHGPEPSQFYWETLPQELANAKVHIYDYPSNIQHPGIASANGIHSIGQSGLCLLIHGFYTGKIKWSNNEYSKRRADGTSIVIVGVDNDVSHEPLYVYSTGEYANGPVGLLNTIKVETENFYESMQATGKHTLSITMGSTEDDADSEQNDIRVVSKANKGKARMVDSPDSTLNLRFHPTSTSTPINTKYKTTLTPRSNVSRGSGMYKSVKSDPKAVELLLSPCNINKDEDEDDNGDHQEVKLWPRQKRKIEDTKINSEAAYKKAKVEGIADDVIYVERLHADTITEESVPAVRETPVYAPNTQQRATAVGAAGIGTSNHPAQANAGYVEVLNGNSLDMIIRDPDDKAIDVHPTNINGKGLLQSSQIYHPIKLHELSDEQLGALIRRNPQAITRAQAMPQQSTADMPLLHTQKLHNGYSVYDPQYGWVQALRWQNDPYQLQYASNYDQPRGYVQPLPYFQPPPPQLAAHKGYMVSTQQSDAANLSPAGWSLHQHPRIHTAYAQSSTHLHSLLFSESRAGTGAFRPVMENNPSINQSQSNR